MTQAERERDREKARKRERDRETVRSREKEKAKSETEKEKDHGNDAMNERLDHTVHCLEFFEEFGDIQHPDNPDHFDGYTFAPPCK